MNNLLKWVGGVSVPFIFGGIVWAVDMRIDQKVTPQIQQLRSDVQHDFRQERIDFLQMKAQAGIITTEEDIELQYLLKKESQQ